LTARKKTQGFRVRCPGCGDTDSLRVALNDVHRIACTNCEEEITPASVRQLIAEWQQVLAWLDTAPELD
jgi:uncharacterized protein (DUF983 family)